MESRHSSQSRIDDLRIAICAISRAVIELDDLPTKEQRERLHFLLRTKLRCTEDEARELKVLGRWLQGQCQDPAAAISRLARRMNKIDGDASFDQLQAMLEDLVGDTLSASQISAIGDIRQAFRR